MFFRDKSNSFCRVIITYLVKIRGTLRIAYISDFIQRQDMQWNKQRGYLENSPRYSNGPVSLLPKNCVSQFKFKYTKNFWKISINKFCISIHLIRLLGLKKLYGLQTCNIIKGAEMRDKYQFMREFCWKKIFHKARSNFSGNMSMTKFNFSSLIKIIRFMKLLN